MMKQDAETIAVYDAKAGEYLKIAPGGGQNRHLVTFASAMPEGAVVLDLGCGPGADSGYLRDLGFQVTALDASAEMAAVARREFGLKVTIGSFDDITGKDIYHGIWASFSLLHAPKADMPRHLLALAKALKPGGVLVIGLKTGDGERRDALGRRYGYYQQAEIAGLLTDAGLTVGKIETGKDRGLDGVVAPWMVITAHG